MTLFDNTILENIRLGCPDASDDKVKQAAYLANCQEFIEKLPQGYETKLVKMVRSYLVVNVNVCLLLVRF